MMLPSAPPTFPFSRIIEMNWTSSIWTYLHLAAENGFCFLPQLLTFLGPIQEGLENESELSHNIKVVDLV